MVLVESVPMAVWTLRTTDGGFRPRNPRRVRYSVYDPIREAHPSSVPVTLDADIRALVATGKIVLVLGPGGWRARLALREARYEEEQVRLAAMADA